MRAVQLATLRGIVGATKAEAAGLPSTVLVTRQALVTAAFLAGAVGVVAILTLPLAAPKAATRRAVALRTNGLDTKDETVQVALELLDRLAPGTGQQRAIAELGAVGPTSGAGQARASALPATGDGGDDAAPSTKAGRSIVALVPTEGVALL